MAVIMVLSSIQVASLTKNSIPSYVASARIEIIWITVAVPSEIVKVPEPSSLSSLRIKPLILQVKNMFSAIQNTNLIILMTPWGEFKTINKYFNFIKKKNESI